MQVIEFIGNLTADPALTEGEGWKVTRFTVAVDRKAKKDGKKETDFFRVSAWNKLGESCYKFLSKGKKCYVHGELQARTYENNDGKTILSLDVQADTVEFLSPKSETQQTEPAAAAPDPRPAPTGKQMSFDDLTDADIPF